MPRVTQHTGSKGPERPCRDSQSRCGHTPRYYRTFSRQQSWRQFLQPARATYGPTPPPKVSSRAAKQLDSAAEDVRAQYCSHCRPHLRLGRGPELQTLRGLLESLEVRVWAHWHSLSQAVEFITQFS